MDDRFMDTDRDMGTVIRERATGLKEPENPHKRLRRRILGNSWFKDEEEKKPEETPTQDEPPKTEVPEVAEGPQDGESNPA